MAEKIIEETQKMGVDMGGTVTGEHGIGLNLRDILQYELGSNAIDMMRAVSSEPSHGISIFGCFNFLKHIDRFAD